jgi:hypothetical protein
MGKWKKKIGTFPDFSRLFPTFPDAFATFYDFLRLNLQPLQALKAKSNPKQTHPKCICDSSSSITTKIFLQILQSLNPANQLIRC